MRLGEAATLLRDEKAPGATVLTGLGLTREQSEQWVLVAIEGYRRAREKFG